MKENFCRIHLDLSQGAIDIEGTQKFVTEQFDNLKNILFESKGVAEIKPARQRRNKMSRQAAIKKEVDLKASGNTLSLLEFYDKAHRPTFLARSLLFLYYLKNIKNHGKITTAHIITCYGEVKATTPSNIYQNVIVGGGKKKWVDVSITKDLKLTPAGIEEVEKVLLAPGKRIAKSKKADIPAIKNKTKARKKTAKKLPRNKKAVSPEATA